MGILEDSEYFWKMASRRPRDEYLYSRLQALVLTVVKVVTASTKGSKAIQSGFENYGNHRFLLSYWPPVSLGFMHWFYEAHKTSAHVDGKIKDTGLPWAYLKLRN